MACWQTGVPWAPPVELLNSNLASALEHVATHFAQWTRQLARAVAYHKRHPAAEEARRCSGRSYGQHGLTYQQWRDREDKRKATRDYYHTIDFRVEDQAAKGRRNCQPAAADIDAKTERGMIEEEVPQSTLTGQGITTKCGTASNGSFTGPRLAPSGSHV